MFCHQVGGPVPGWAYKLEGLQQEFYGVGHAKSWTREEFARIPHAFPAPRALYYTRALFKHLLHIEHLHKRLYCIKLYTINEMKVRKGFQTVVYSSSIYFNNYT